jgi:hypothetical protein
MALVLTGAVPSAWRGDVAHPASSVMSAENNENVRISIVLPLALVKTYYAGVNCLSTNGQLFDNVPEKQKDDRGKIYAPFFRKFHLTLIVKYFTLNIWTFYMNVN